MLVAGMVFSLIFGTNGSGALAIILFSGFLVREWCFGFPNLILHPPRDD